MSCEAREKGHAPVRLICGTHAVASCIENAIKIHLLRGHYQCRRFERIGMLQQVFIIFAVGLGRLVYRRCAHEEKNQFGLR